MTVRTRFAPSPTGLLHIGGARNALFNWLYARHHGGEYLLRIEDTDRERSTEPAVRAILEGLDWLGLMPDEPVVFQSARQARHTEVALAMLATGHAYRAYDTVEELAAGRDRARAEKRAPRYNGKWRDRDPADAPAGIAPVIRLRAPQTGETLVEDLVQGEVRVANAELDDMIILRSDGTPTYLHAVVVDDHDMRISHVIRSDDHLTNTFRQLQLYHAMGWEPPAFAHAPLIHGADGAKLSKRHGATSVLEFREQGFLPEALCNYILRLGWAHGDSEILSRGEARRLFDLDGVGRAASRFDYAKLTHINGVWLRAADDERLAVDVLHRLSQMAGLTIDAVIEHRVRSLMPGLKERAKTVAELAEMTTFLARTVPLPMEPKAAALLSEAKPWLPALADALDATDFAAPSLDAALRAFAAQRDQKLAAIAQPLRAALTGSTASPPIDATLAALGREETLRRIRVTLG